MSGMAEEADPVAIGGGVETAPFGPKVKARSRWGDAG
jgi:hypothetical protein